MDEDKMYAAGFAAVLVSFALLVLAIAWRIVTE